MVQKKGKRFLDINIGPQVLANAKKSATRGSQYGYLNLPRGVNVFKEEPGSIVKLDFLLYTVKDKKHLDRDPEIGSALVGNLWYKKPFWLHRNIGTNNEAVVCPTTIGKPCPVCEYRKRRKKEGADDIEIKALKTSLRNLYIVVPRGHKNYEEKPHIWDISYYLFQDYLEDEMELDEDKQFFANYNELGKTLKIRFSEENFMGNKFAKTARIDFLDRDKPIDDELIDNVPDLDSVLIIHPYEKIENMLFDVPNEDEYEDDEDEDEEEEEENKPKRKAKTVKKKS